MWETNSHSTINCMRVKVITYEILNDVIKWKTCDKKNLMIGVPMYGWVSTNEKTSVCMIWSINDEVQ